MAPSSFRVLVAGTVGVVIWLIWLTGMTGDSRHVTMLALSQVSLLGTGLVVALRRACGAEERARECEQCQRQAREAADAANQSKSRFLATMSHELRTPLNAIIGFAELMQRPLPGPADNDKYCSYAADIQTSGMHLLRVINDILDLTKVEAGKLELHEDVIDPREVVGSVARVIAAEVTKAGLTISLDLPTELPLLCADERQTRQVLFNLIGNAVKFTPRGGRIEIAARGDPRTGLRISVADNGIGIASDDLVRVLEPFVQVDSPLSRQHDGTGLGLPAAKAIMGLHGGTLELKSAIDVGTEVAISFPPERIVERNQIPLPLQSAA